MFVTEVDMRHRYRESCDHVSYRGKYVFREKKAHSYALAANDGDSFLLKDSSVAKAAVCAGQQSVFILFRCVWCWSNWKLAYGCCSSVQTGVRWWLLPHRGKCPSPGQSSSPSSTRRINPPLSPWFGTDWNQRQWIWSLEPSEVCFYGFQVRRRIAPKSQMFMVAF